MSEELKAALARIACLEGEIAKRDEELAACRVAVENCEMFRARIVELESRYQRDVYGLNNEGDPIGGEPAGGYANDNARLRAELAALKAQDTVGEVIGWYRLDRPYEMTSYPSVCATWHKLGAPVAPLYAAPVSEAKAQGVVMQATDGGRNPRYEGLFDGETEEQRASRLNATPVQQVSVPDGFRVMNPTSAVVRDGDRWEIYAPCGSGGIVHEDDVRDWVVRKLLDAIAAAPAAPAADAGVVDMYRHLQKVTPYRFKKIQDASITDGGDVMYFHKDRFDAALLADMAAHCAAKGVV